MPVALNTAAASRLSLAAFPAATPLNAFVAWNEARNAKDRRYRIICDIYQILHDLDGETCLAHLAGWPLALRRSGIQIAAAPAAQARAKKFLAESAGAPGVKAAKRVIDSLRAAIGSLDMARHAAVFRAFELLARHVDLDAVARLRPQPTARRMPSERRRILIIKLGALGDFIQALGPVPAIRRHHAGDHIALLTTVRYAALAAQSGLFDDILVDRRPRGFDVPGWLALHRMLRRQRFDRVYDFQTSDRSNAYFWLLRPGRPPEWSGTAWRCSHPHANRGRDRQHTMDRQAEQLLMAGIYPVPLTPWLPTAASLPAALTGRRFALLIPGSSPSHPAKRWPAESYGKLAAGLARACFLPVVVGVAGEEPLGRAICGMCPEVVDLIGQTDVAGLAGLAGAAALTIGNDTGATHVAAAGGHPVVVLFSSASDPSLCAPRGAAVRVLIEPDLAKVAVETVLTAGLEAAQAGTAAAAVH
jgi:ADP-heptose:LPS heptosyltransferase